MGQLVKVTQSALTSEESGSRNIQQRNLLSDALRLLNEHEAALVKGYPMALLEIFAEGPAVAKGRSSADDTGMDFGELSLMDESEMQAQVELSKAQQSALHATDAVLAELNTLVSAAQGLRSVQPERNPLRPESYIRALQQVVHIGLNVFGPLRQAGQHIAPQVDARKQVFTKAPCRHLGAQVTVGASHQLKVAPHLAVAAQGVEAFFLHGL